MAWPSFTELDKAVVHVIRLTSFLWLWFQCVCLLMPSRNRLTWVFSYLGRGVSLHGCSSKAQLLLLTLDEGYLLMAAPPDLERGIASLDTPAPMRHRSLGVGLLLPATAPGLRQYEKAK